VASERGSRKLDEGELLRFLAESVWFPTVLLPGGCVRWEEVDYSTATAVLRDRDREVSTTFHFNDKDEIERASTQRYRLVEGGYKLVSWTGYYGDYRRMGGILLPTEARVVWNLPDGDFEYWRGRLMGIEYEP